MKKFSLYSFILFVQMASLIALHRDYDGEEDQWYREYCVNHANIPHHAHEIVPYLSLIPTLEGIQCKKVSCSTCDSVFILEGFYGLENEEMDSEDDSAARFPLKEPYWLCDCKIEQYDTKRENSSYFFCPYGVNLCHCDYDVSCKYDWMPTWTQCKKPAIYGGYLSILHAKYFSFLRSHLEYINENKECSCYWPEATLFAAKISNGAYTSIRRILTKTPLSKVLEDVSLQQEIHGASQFLNYVISLNDHETARALICQCFLYSNYDQVLEELEHISKNHLSIEEHAQVKEAIEKTRHFLCINFATLNRRCYNKHPHPKIAREFKFIDSLLALKAMIAENADNKKP